MIHTGQTIEGPFPSPDSRREKFLVVRAGAIRRHDGGQRVVARRQSEGFGGTLMEIEATLDFPDPEDIEPWRVIE